METNKIPSQSEVYNEILADTYSMVLDGDVPAAIQNLRIGFPLMRPVQARAIVDFLYFVRRSSMGEQRETDKTRYLSTIGTVRTLVSRALNDAENITILGGE